ncbi:OLC1v1002122C1 [Oldenlandia corymbosa var. corymbosa]|uniref:OLC1v1002122C1 n=1 Tax=Oldenlandia corymbosa var. corymbosa TaxID=529605 RepID=A0AAV1D6W3_OLDCO|nr:OLC1v1002122C1 [Oldenlandia corymbosa var. corymbosa]
MDQPMMHHLALISWIPFSLVVIYLSLNLIQKRKKRSREVKKQPPGPWKLPLIGNLHQMMGSLPHRVLHKLAQKHGDLMHLQLGEVSAIVVSSPRATKEFLKTHDVAFADRPSFTVGNIIFYNYSDIIFCPYSDYWRQMRKICTQELLSTKNVRSLGSIRQDEVLKLVSSIKQGVIVNVTRKVCAYTSSMICRAVFGQTLGSHDRGALVQLLQEVITMSSGFDVYDVFPSWKILHRLMGNKPRLLELHDKIDEILDTIIQQHLDNPTGRNGEFGQEDLIDVLLRIKQSREFPLPITNTHIKAVILDMFGGGANTSATAVEWAMAEMIRNPDVLAKAQNEIRKALPPGNKILEETDIQQFSYLKLIIKETLRLHPPAPLIPRESREPCEVDGYLIPPKTRVIFNIWANGRDPNYWNDAESFKPERFQNDSVDMLGGNYEFLPFGAGRRICPGLSFGLANLEVPLAYLVCYFDWKLPYDIKHDVLDMREAYGSTAVRKNNLCLVPYFHDFSGTP